MNYKTDYCSNQDTDIPRERQISIVDAVSPAIAWTKLMLFRPFDFSKWLAVGFCAWLATLGEGGGFHLRLPLNRSGGGGPGSPGQVFRDVKTWINQNMELVITITVAVVILALVLGLLIAWLKSRATFMFIDNVARNQAEVKKPWHAYRDQGWSLFCFRIVFGIFCFLAFMILAGICALPFITSIQSRQLLPMGIAGIIFSIIAFLCWALLLGFVNVLINDIVIPIMYRRRCSFTAAWHEFRQVTSGKFSTLVLYFLFKIALGMGVGFIAMVVGFLACCFCLTSIPFVGTLLLLPLLVFSRSYTLYFMQQLHPDYLMLPDDPDSIVPEGP